MPRARRPLRPATPSPASTTSATVADTAEPVITSRTTQPAATPPATAQRLRLRCRSGARACRPAGSPPSAIDTVLDPSYPVVIVGPRHRGCGPARPRVNESAAASRHLEVAREPESGPGERGHRPFGFPVRTDRGDPLVVVDGVDDHAVHRDRRAALAQP